MRLVVLYRKLLGSEIAGLGTVRQKALPIFNEVGCIHLISLDRRANQQQPRRASISSGDGTD
jgi:hypothetical protein